MDLPTPTPYVNPDTKEPEWTEGDVTLISSDNISFKVFKYVLQYHSLTFREMFDLPLTESTIKVSESQVVVERMLTAMRYFGIPAPPSTSVAMTQDLLLKSEYDVFKAARKYQLHLILPNFREKLVNIASHESGEAAFIGFVIGCQENWLDLCKASLHHFNKLKRDWEYPSWGEPWNWSLEQVDLVGNKRFMDFLQAFSKGSNRVAAEKPLYEHHYTWEKVAEAFKFS